MGALHLGRRAPLALHHDRGIPACLGAQHPPGGSAAFFDHVPLDGGLTMHLIELLLLSRTIPGQSFGIVGGATALSWKIPQSKFDCILAAQSPKMRPDG